MAAAVAATLTCAAPAAAAEHPDYAGALHRHAGSQIALHEGVHGTPRATAGYAAAGRTLGHDVSGWQGAVDWPDTTGKGARFVYVKATEGTGFVSPQFTQQYNGSYQAGMIRGAYHFARPDISGGAEQADYFVQHGGGWSADGRTLPGALDVEYNPYGDTCYDLEPAGMVEWIKDFSARYAERTGRPPAIYTSTSWWRTCTGNSPEFGATHPLWLARYAPEIGPLPAGWPTQTIWQFANAGPLPGDQNYFNGAEARLAALAQGEPRP
ncbi:lysozyme [Amycolatopsis aidingensis]|uniref:lysozyme n=1 Tax=Amycolatopsis aidingensis TaxID=2842453 RepID=UPI001C0D1E49|nr:lysozyme [Amycolatopsis aidingensis]